MTATQGKEKPPRPRRMFGRLRLLPSGKWQASYVGADQKRHTAPTTFATKTDGGAWLAMRQAELVEHRWKPPAPPVAPDAPTLADYSAQWLESRRNAHGEPLRPRTVVLYRRILDGIILPRFGALPLDLITAEDVEAWHRALLPDAPVRRAHAYSLLSSIMRTAAEGRVILTSPCTIRGAAKPPRGPEIRPASSTEVAALADAMPDRYRAALLIAAWGGLRFGELTALRRRDVDLDPLRVHVRRAVVRVGGAVTYGPPKSRAGVRVVALPPALRPALERHLRDHVEDDPDALLFTALTDPGTPLPAGTLAKPWNRARRSIGRPELSWHSLRHHAGTAAAIAGATLSETMSRMGHSSVGASLRYQHAAADRDAAIAAKLNALITP